MREYSLLESGNIQCFQLYMLALDVRVFQQKSHSSFNIFHTETGSFFRRHSDIGLAEVESHTGKEDERAVLLEGGAIKSIPSGVRIPPSFSTFIRFTKESISFFLRQGQLLVLQVCLCLFACVYFACQVHYAGRVILDRKSNVTQSSVRKPLYRI